MHIGSCLILTVSAASVWTSTGRWTSSTLATEPEGTRDSERPRRLPRRSSPARFPHPSPAAKRGITYGRAHAGAYT
eukprot:4796637-Pyramimonas_sp.AAC.1